MAVIDLSQLPAPQIVDVPDFETLLAERKAAFVALYPADEQDAVRRTLALESEPVTLTTQHGKHHLRRCRTGCAGICHAPVRASGVKLIGRRRSRNGQAFKRSRNTQAQRLIAFHYCRDRRQ